MAKKANDNTQTDSLISNKIVLRSCYGKTGQKYFVQPHKDKLGHFPDVVKKIDSKGDMIMTDAERNSGKIFIPENFELTIEDNFTFDLNDPIQAAQWEAIKYCPLIAESRDAKDADGNYLIDGTPDKHAGRARYGRAELYIDRPGYLADKKVKNIEIKYKATGYVLESDMVKNKHICKVFGRNMDNSPVQEIREFLLSVAEKTPNKIIEIYTGGDLSLKLLLITAKEQGIIYAKQGLYYYGEDGNTILGSSEDTVINWMKQPANAKTLSLIRKDTFPDMDTND